MTEQRERPRLSDLRRAVDDIEIPCEFPDCDAAAWWHVTTTHECDRHNRHGFLCGQHLTWVLVTDEPLRCATTGERFDPAATWVASWQPI